MTRWTQAQDAVVEADRRRQEVASLVARHGDARLRVERATTDVDHDHAIDCTGLTADSLAAGSGLLIEAGPPPGAGGDEGVLLPRGGRLPASGQ